MVLTHDEIPLRSLRISDLLVEGVVGQVGLGEQAGVPECLRDLLGIVEVGLSNGDDYDLARVEP